MHKTIVAFWKSEKIKRILIVYFILLRNICDGVYETPIY
uniref:Uncharacterized protein n=1 Tax=Anguilla anguilla TaxID=7936 RepID=A0A0E9RFN6_ANGAN